MPLPCALIGSRPGAFCCLLLLLIWLCPAWAASLWEEEQQRLRVGLHLFPAVLGAQEDLSAQRNAEGVLEIVVVHKTSEQAAKQAVRALKELGQVQEIALALTILPVEQLPATHDRSLAAIFIASSRLEPALLRRLSEQHQVLVFSPFEGDVAAGAVAGLHVTDRILPAINLKQAQRAGLSFKPFFLGIAHHAD